MYSDLELTATIRQISQDRNELLDLLDATARKKALAIALVTVRKKMGLTQIQVAECTGFKQPFISKLESPSGPMPTAETISRYAHVCGVQLVVSFCSGNNDLSRSVPISAAAI